MARWWVVTTQTKDNQLVQTNGVTTVKPADLKFLNRQLITVGFVPTGTTLPKPPGSHDHGPAAGPRGKPARRHDHDHGGVGDHDHSAPLGHDELDGRDDDHGTLDDDHDGGADDHHDEAFVHHDDEVMKAVVLVGGEGTRLRPLTLHVPQADAPDRRRADDRACPRPPRFARRGRGGPLPRLPSRRLHGGIPRRPGRRRAADLRRRARAPRHGRAPCASRRPSPASPTPSSW